MPQKLIAKVEYKGNLGTITYNEKTRKGEVHLPKKIRTEVIKYFNTKKTFMVPTGPIIDHYNVEDHLPLENMFFFSAALNELLVNTGVCVKEVETFEED
jgi:hypothetical protein